MAKIDVNIDFTTVTEGYWDNFWENRYGLGGSNVDPDTKCQTLQLYHQMLWSKKLPNGESMELEIKKDNFGYYLKWKDYIFSRSVFSLKYKLVS